MENAPLPDQERPPDVSALENRIREIGLSLYAAMRHEGRGRFASSYVSGKALQRRLLGQAMGDPVFKTQLFRFVDVYPSLRDQADLVRHLRAYFADGALLPRPFDRLLATGAKRLPTWLVARLTEKGMQRMGSTLIAGRDAIEALPTLRRLRRRHTAFTLDVLGEACLSEIEAQRYLQRYHELLDILPPLTDRWPGDPAIDEAPWGAEPRLNLSLKLSSVYSQIDPADFEGSRQALVGALKPFFLKAKGRGAFLNLDVERFVHRDLTYAVFADLCLDPDLRDYPHLGVAVQAYLRDSEATITDLIRLARERATPFTIRLVKGAYWDYETILAAQEHWPPPVFLDKAETDLQFERLFALMLTAWPTLRPAVGTHNLRSIAAALALAEASGLPPRAVEIQVLHGMADSIRQAAVAQGLRVREYVPVGELIPGMAYLVRRLLENTANESCLRLTFTHCENPEMLLAPPRPAESQADKSQPGEPHAFQNEPHADFSRKEVRTAMQRALTTIQASLGRQYPLLIGGEAVETTTYIESLNPARPAQVIGRVAAAGPAEVDQAIVAAAAAFPSWRDTPASERARLLFQAAALIRQRRFELAALEILEAGKPWREADADVTEAIDFLEYYGREVLRLSPPRALSDVPGEEDYYLYEPRGVAAVIAPWNFPLAIPMGMVSAALAAGNTVIFKPASATPVLGYALVRILHEAGVPGPVLNFLPGAGEEVGDRLVADPRMDLIAFTGSLATGLSILEKAAAVAPGQRSLKRVVAELGGKNAIIVDTDADLDAAVEGIVVSAFHYSGQKCSACSRVLVLEPIYEQFLKRLVPAVASLRVGNPADPATRVGPVISAAARQRIREFIEKGKEEATLVLPEATAPPPGQAAEDTPGEPAEEGYFVAPHIFVDVPPEAVIAQEEIFGPVLAVMKVANLDEAFRIALGVRYALTGGLYSRNPAHIRRAYREFRVGNLYINRPITGAMVGRQPFGGSRMSGVGSKAGGPDYLLQFLEPRTVTENTVRRGFAPWHHT